MKQLAEIKIGPVLSYFMKKLDLNDQALANETGVPLPTIARLRRGKDVNPTATTLRPLADFFNITVGQLLGDEPIDDSSPVKQMQQTLPVLEWEQVNQELNKPANEYVAIKQQVSAQAFALVMNATTQNVLFQRGTLLIIDPAIAPVDGDFVLITEAGAAPAIKQILIDGKDKYSKSINPEISAIRLLTAEDKIIGIVLEARHSFK